MEAHMSSDFVDPQTSIRRIRNNNALLSAIFAALSCAITLEDDSVHRPGNFTGDLVMYKDNDLSGKKLQVQIRTWMPFGTSSSVCGVAFLYGRTLIKVDMCTTHPNMTAPVITQGDKGSDGVKTYLCGGSNYEIMTPVGVRLSIVLANHHLDLKLHIPPALHGHVNGACLVHKEGNQFFSSDELKRFGLSSDQSFFDDAASRFMQTVSSISYPTSYCLCEHSQPVCHPYLHLQDPAAPYIVDETGKETVKRGCSLIMPRSINPEQTPKDLLNIAGDQPFNRTYIHQYQTFQFCTAAIGYHANSFCKVSYSMQESIFKSVCAKDIQNTNEKEEYQVSAVQGFNWYCQEEALGKKYLTLPTAVTTDMCSSPCSIRGTCVNGLCSCEDGFEGPDCSVNKTATPLILGIKGGDVCGMSSLHCDDPILITRNVYPGKSLQVHMEAKSAVSRNPQIQSFHLEPVYANTFSVSLPMLHTIESLLLQDKTAVIFTLTISNTGQVFSQPYNYLIFDDKCMLCQTSDSSFQCLLKENACRIDGKCYSTMEVNPVNSSQLCDPDKAMLHWSGVYHASNGSDSVQVPVIG